jgi:two-component system, cell cycle response regulator
LKVLMASSDEFARGAAPGLRERGWEVVAAHDVPTALMTATRHHPDVVVVAAQLPGGRGHGLAAKLQSLSVTASIPLVGIADDPLEWEALHAAGVQRCLPTTAGAAELAAVLAAEGGVTGHEMPATAPRHAFPGGLLAPEAGCGKVLLVEDDEAVRSMVSQALLLEGHEVVAFDSAEAALEATLAGTPDVVLLDVMLPGMSGLEMLDRMRGDDRLCHVPVILISALDGETVVEGLKGGAQDYVRKPFAIDELLARVAGTLTTKRARDGLDERVSDLEHLALTDELTGLDNRRAAERHLERLTAQAARTGRPLSALLLDVDRFKAVNDTYGHHVGDEILAALAQELTGASRAADVIARWGGEEFVVLLPDTDLERAQLVAERLRATVAAMEPPVPEFAGEVTVSIGVAATTDSPRRLLVDADAALYRAKTDGRNRIAATSARAAGRALAGLLATPARPEPSRTELIS